MQHVLHFHEIRFIELTFQLNFDSQKTDVGEGKRTWQLISRLAYIIIVK